MSIEAIGLISPILQFTDASGVPLAGGSLTFVQVGTSTAQVVYSDSALTVSLGNVVTLNAAGRTSTSASGPDTTVYLQQKTYDVTLKDSAGVTVWGPETVSGSQWPGQIQGVAILSPAANANGYTNRLTTTIDKAASGTHSLFAGTRFDATTVNAGAAVLTEAATVYIEGSPTAGSAAYALHVGATNGGAVRFDGPVSFANNAQNICSGRLTLTTGVPVTTSDVTGATTVYFTPYRGNSIGLYDGTATWTLLAFTETSIALGTLTSGLPYDVFGYNNSGVLALELAAWSSATAIFSSGTYQTTRPTQDGIIVKSTNGTTVDSSRRYLGTFTTSSTTQTEDSNANRLLYNYYNRVRRPLLVTDTTASWNYSLAVWRQARATATNQVRLTQGVAETPVFLRLHIQAANDTGTMNVNGGIGEDSTSAPLSAQTVTDMVIAGANFSLASDAMLEKIPAVGLHTYVWLESAEATGVTTFRGASSTTAGAATTSGVGLTGWCEA